MGSVAWVRGMILMEGSMGSIVRMIAQSSAASSWMLVASQRTAVEAIPPPLPSSPYRNSAVISVAATFLLCTTC
jgi:hypothetical protein